MIGPIVPPYVFPYGCNLHIAIGGTRLCSHPSSRLGHQRRWCTGSAAKAAKRASAAAVHQGPLGDVTPTSYN